MESVTPIHECDGSHAPAIPANVPLGDALKTSALQKIDQARALMNSAGEDLCNLEGPGYCKRYEQVGDLYGRLGVVASYLRQLPPPTGVWGAKKEGAL
jgi:hypothetical protein